MCPQHTISSGGLLRCAGSSDLGRKSLDLMGTGTGLAVPTRMRQPGFDLNSKLTETLVWLDVQGGEAL